MYWKGDKNYGPLGVTSLRYTGKECLVKYYITVVTKRTGQRLRTVEKRRVNVVEEEYSEDEVEDGEYMPVVERGGMIKDK